MTVSQFSECSIESRSSKITVLPVFINKANIIH